MNHKHHTLCLIGLTFVSGSALADLHLEVSPGMIAADGQEDFSGDVGLAEPLRVWLWSDEPITVLEIRFEINAVYLGSLSHNSTAAQIGSIGVADPTGFFESSFSGTMSGVDGNVAGITLSAFDFGVEIPTSVQNALLVYDSFDATPLNNFGGVLARWDGFSVPSGQPSTSAQTHGWYAVPSPGASLVFIATGLHCLKRRRH